MNTRSERLDRMRSRASALRIAFVVLLIAGVVGSVVLGIQAGRSINFNTGILFTSSSTHNTARGVTVFFVGLVGTVITTLPLLGISWIIDGQADLVEGLPDDTRG
jgi:hypothetical protein